MNTILRVWKKRSNDWEREEWLPDRITSGKSAKWGSRRLCFQMNRRKKSNNCRIWTHWLGCKGKTEGLTDWQLEGWVEETKTKRTRKNQEERKVIDMKMLDTVAREGKIHCRVKVWRRGWEKGKLGDGRRQIKQKHKDEDGKGTME